MRRDAAGGEPPESVGEPVGPQPASKEVNVPAGTDAALAAEVPAVSATALPQAPAAGVPPVPAVLAPGSRVGNFVILDALGATSDTAFYVAEDRLERLNVVLAVVPARDAADRGRRARFMSEARILSLLARQHPNFVPPLGFGEHDGWLFLSTPRVDGLSLAQHLAQAGPLTPAEMFGVLRPIADALDTAHRHGLVHGNVSPANILLGDDGRVLLAGFEIGRRRQALAGREIDVRALARVLYESLMARPKTAKGRASQPGSSVPLGGLPPAVEQVLAGALAYGAEGRFSSCAELLDAFADAIGWAPQPSASTRRSERDRSWSSVLVGVGMAMAAALGLVGMTFAAGFWVASPAPVQPPAGVQGATAQATTSPATGIPSASPPALTAAPTSSPHASLELPPWPAATQGTLPAITVGDGRVDGSRIGTRLEFTISLSRASGAIIAVTYQTLDGTALAGADYDAVEGTVDIPAGQTSAVVGVQVAAASDGEADESFSLRVLSATNAQIVDGTGTGTIVAAQPNVAPVCEPRSVSVPAGGSTQLNPPCADADGDTLSVEVVDGARSGRARVAGGKLRYEAGNGARGIDSFTYRASDGTLTSEPATVTVTITGGRQRNRAPVCRPREMVVQTGDASTVDPRCTDPDTDRLTYRIVAQGRKGIASVTDGGRLRYRADTGRSGSDTFTYSASDGSRSSAPVTVTVTIGGPPP